MENQRPPKNDRLFHFQLDLPDRPASKTEQASNSTIQTKAGSARQKAVKGQTVRSVAAHTKHAAAKQSTAARTASSRTASHNAHRTSAQNSDRTKSVSVIRCRRQKIHFSLIRSQDSFKEISAFSTLIFFPAAIFYMEILEEITGQKFGNSEDTQQLNEENINFDVYKNSLVIWSASMTEPVTVNKVCGQVDILPTLSNLLGLNYDSRLLEGTDIMSDSEGLVIFASRSRKSDKGFYNSYTKEFTPAEGVSMTDS